MTLLRPCRLSLTRRQHHKVRLLAKHGIAGVNLFVEWRGLLLGLGMTPAQEGALVAGTLGKILSGVLARQATTSWTSLDLISQANRDRIGHWNAEEVQPTERCIHDMIAHHVQERPDHEAVCAWDGSFTFRELDAVAGQLASKLAGLGVGPEVLIPLCFEKSVCLCICHRFAAKQV